MDDVLEKFSKAEFESRLRSGAGTVELSRQLEDEVRSAVMGAMVREMSDIVGELGALGHRLELFEPVARDNVAFRDESTEHGVYVCKLHLACDVVISCGFRDTRSLDQFEEPD